MEHTFRVSDDRPFGSLKSQPDGSLYTEKDRASGLPAVELRPAPNGACEARIGNEYKKSIDMYTLRRTELNSWPATSTH
jgi:hypothetical protein